MPTKVAICFFKPTGYEDTHLVDTEHRGDAARAVMDLYPDDIEMWCLNTIVCSLISQSEADKLIKRTGAVMLKADNARISPMGGG